MSTEDKKTDNELIAEFMGQELTIDRIQLSDRVETVYYLKDSHYPTELLYAESWDWLMSVVEKIATLPIIGKHQSGTVRFYLYGDGVSVCKIGYEKEHEGKLIEATYQSVVQFIRWYNKQPK